MLLFGHLGITLGIFLGLRFLIPQLKSAINLKYLAIGAILPDLIDKPIGRIILASTFENGRMIGHTLLVSIIIFLIGLYFYQKRKDNRWLSLSIGSFFHLVEDQIWAQPKTFFWPLLGLSFPKDSADYTGIEYLLIMLEKSFRPELSQTFITEILGIAIIGIFGIYWLKKKREEKNSS